MSGLNRKAAKNNVWGVFPKRLDREWFPLAALGRIASIENIARFIAILSRCGLGPTTVHRREGFGRDALCMRAQSHVFTNQSSRITIVKNRHIAFTECVDTI